MKKNDFIYPAIFLVVVLFLFIIPIGAFLTSEIVGWKSSKSISSFAYRFLKDHGSLVAGLIGFMGVYILIWNQNKETKKLIESNIALMRTEAFEINKSKALEHAMKIKANFEELDRAYMSSGEMTPVNSVDENLKEISFSSNYIDDYLTRCICFSNGITSLIYDYINLHRLLESENKEDVRQVSIYVKGRLAGRHAADREFKKIFGKGVKDNIHIVLQGRIVSFAEFQVETWSASLVARYLQVYISRYVLPDFLDDIRKSRMLGLPKY